MKSFVDEGPTIRIYYDLEGQRRKDLVKALGEILLWEPKYLGAPTFSYEVGNYIVTKIGAIICPESCTREIAEQIILKLKERGFEHTGSNLMLFVVSLPKSMFDEDSLVRLCSLVKSKEKLLKAALEPDYVVTTMISGKMAIKFLKTKTPDLIFLDYQMPVEDGPEVFKNIRALDSSKDVPIVFLTGVADRSKIANVLMLKPQGYLLKPIDIERVNETIHRIFDSGDEEL